MAIFVAAALVGCQDTNYNTSSTIAEDEVADALVEPDGDAEEATPDTQPEDSPPGEDVPEPDTPCPMLSQSECLETGRCVLELGPLPDEYVCRPADNVCERQVDETLCGVLEGCVWQPGACYCPEGAVCGCGGGPPPICRQQGDPTPCRGPGSGFCEGEARCCVPEGASLGLCVDQGEACGDEPGLSLVGLDVRGGLCQDGPCFTSLQIRRGGDLTVDNETPRPPIEDTLAPEVLTSLLEILGRIDPTALEEGYGPCCEADSDGSDNYVTFFDRGQPVREIRISSGPLPADLEALKTLLEREAYSRLNEP